MIVVAMLLHCKGGFMKDKRLPKGGAKNKQREYLNEETIAAIEESRSGNCKSFDTIEELMEDLFDEEE